MGGAPVHGGKLSERLSDGYSGEPLLFVRSAGARQALRTQRASFTEVCGEAKEGLCCTSRKARKIEKTPGMLPLLYEEAEPFDS